MKKEYDLTFDDAVGASEEEDDDSISPFMEKAPENEERTDLKFQFWTDAEDQLLFEALERNGKNWADVANYFENADLRDFKNRSQLQCMTRFRYIVRTTSEKMKHVKKWNDAEEQELWNAHKRFKCDWDSIASHVANGSIASECKHKLYAMHVSRIANCKNSIVAKDTAKHDSQLGRTNVVDNSEAQTRKPIHRRHRKKRARNLINPVTPESVKVKGSFSNVYSDTWSLNTDAKRCSSDKLSIIQGVSRQADNQVQIAEKRQAEVTESRAPKKERDLEECKTELAEIKAFMVEMKSEIMSTVAEMKSDIIAEIKAELRGIIAC